jgi:hypothetical protein
MNHRAMIGIILWGCAAVSTGCGVIIESDGLEDLGLWFAIAAATASIVASVHWSARAQIVALALWHDDIELGDVQDDQDVERILTTWRTRIGERQHYHG